MPARANGEPPCSAGNLAGDGEDALPLVEVVPGAEAVVTSASTPEEREAQGKALSPPEGPEIGRAALALVFSSPEPVPAGKLASALGVPAASVREALEGESARIARAALPFALTEIAGGWRFLTEGTYDPWIARLRGLGRRERLSAAGLETLAIVAYRQPVTKAEVETIRGVQAGPILRSLLERRLLRVVGRAPVPGRPLQYGTTREFLDRFGLPSIRDLPRPEEVARG